MRRQAIVATAMLGLTGMCLAGVDAAAAAPKKKKKPAPITGKYELGMRPDPTQVVVAATGSPGCAGQGPVGKDRHPFVLPAAGTLVVTLEDANKVNGTQSVPATGTSNWDMFLMSGGQELKASEGPTAVEKVELTVTKKTDVSIDVCNVVGVSGAIVKYTFTYK